MFAIVPAGFIREIFSLAAYRLVIIQTKQEAENMKRLKAITSLLVALALGILFFACAPTNNGKKLDTPQNVVCTDDGIISWDAVENAAEYVVVVDGVNYTAKGTTFKVSDTSRDYEYSVYATAEGYTPSDPSPVKKGKAYEIKGTLAAPQNVAIDKTGLITWDVVENAEKYMVVINGTEYTAETNSFTAPSTDDDFSVVVYAQAAHYKKSAPSTEVSFAGLGKITVSVKAEGNLYSGKTLTLTATVTGAFGDDSVCWSIVNGLENAEIDKDTGVITANIVSSDTSVTVRATSNLNPAKYDEKVINVIARPALTEDMLSELAAADKVAFEGYMSIDLYQLGLVEKYYNSFKYVIKTAMDGEYWYSQYVSPSTGLTTGLYYKNQNGIASMVSVDLMNEEHYTPLTDEKEKAISWEESGFYNPFKGLSVSDFTFDEDEWKYRYTGKDETLPARMIAASDPYDFVPSEVYLMIEDGAVAGIYSVAEPSYTVAAGYVAYNTLNAAVNYGDDVEVEKIAKYSHESRYDEYYSKFAEAIENMKKLDSYETTFVNYQSVAGSSPKISGYREYLTENDCYFKPFTITARDDEGNYVYNYTGADYGYRQLGKEFYNAYSKSVDKEGNVKWTANRAYRKDFASARPSFAFSGEIFRTIICDPEKPDTVTFVADIGMTNVASTLFYGMGNEINLYGLFATGYNIFGNPLETELITNVTIENGYITKAQFYYYFDYFYGIVELTYGGFNQTVLPEEAKTVNFETREIPSSWADPSLFISVAPEDSSIITDYVEKPLPEYLEKFFGSKQTADEMPFFGIPLGDSFGFSIQSSKVPGGMHYGIPAITFYYDVPLDLDLTIDSSLNAVKEYLLSLGYERNAYGEYVKGDITVKAESVDLDLNIYVWKTPSEEEK